MQDLVQIKDKEVFTTSRNIAKDFLKRHSDVLRSIENLECSEDFYIRNYALVNYKDKKGEMRKEYQLTRDGFSFLVMGFTGKKVAIWKERYIKAFNKMEKALIQVAINQKNNEWLEKRKSSKIARKEETKVIQEFVEYAENQGSKNAKRYYSNITKMEYKHLYLITGKFKNVRDVLSSRQLHFQATCDEIVKKALIDGMKQKLHYKEIYQKAKNNVMSFADLMPKTNVPEINLLES